ncbi:MAG: 8-oxo-dGTP diphosphatase [Clostridiales bacterium]|nr:8-oxo-dGTP diphosphatase [Clostridiales bacterium]
MKNTTLCYIERDGAYLMLHRVTKKHDINHGKWIGVGGKFEPGETPEECLLREVKEETGLTLPDYRLRGIITFVQDGETEYMFLYTAHSFEGELISCNEGELAWIPKQDILNLELWEGDREFLRLLDSESGFFP